MDEFSSIIGYEPIKKELKKIVDMAQNPDVYAKMGATMPKGVLLYGDPGLGKTMLAEAAVKASKMPFFVLRKTKDNASALEEIAKVFSEAEKASPCAILIDDMDKFSSSKEDDSDSEAFVAIQSGIDKVRSKSVLVVATVNQIHKLPRSLLRSGRFDSLIEVDAPVGEDARKIISFYLKGKPLSPDFNFDDCAKMISYSSCADLQSILNKSAICAAYDRQEFISIDNVVDACVNGQGDDRLEDCSCEKEELEAVAIHEAGHIAISEALQKGSVGFSWLRCSGGSPCGFTRPCRNAKRRPEEVLICLGGKAAAELFASGRCASGCQSDLYRASNLLQGGIGDNGTLGLGLYNALDEERTATYAAKLENAVQGEMDRYMFMARDALIKNRDFVLALAKKLGEKHYLLFSDIQAIRANYEVKGIILP